jgi:outer membrane protein
MLRKLCLLALLAAAAVPVRAQSVKIGVFDPNKLLTSSKLGQSLQEDLNRFRVGREAELKKSGEDLDKLVKQYKTGVETMSPERRDEIEADLAGRKRDLDRMAHDAEGDLQRRRQKAVHDLEQRVASILDDYGKKNGYTLILQRDLCAYAVDSIDISDDLVKLLDASNAKK